MGHHHQNWLPIREKNMVQAKTGDRTTTMCEHANRMSRRWHLRPSTTRMCFFSKHKRNIGLGKNPFKPLALGIFPIAHVGFKKHFVRVKSLCKTHWIANILIGWIVAISLHYFTFKIGHMCLLSDRSKHTKCDMRHVAQRVNSIQMNTSNDPWNNIELSDFPSILWTKLKQQL